MQHLVKLVRDTYYSHVEELTDTVHLFKIIFKDIPEDQLRQILGISAKEPVPGPEPAKEPAPEPAKEPAPEPAKEPAIIAPENIIASLRKRELTGDQRSVEWLLQRVNYITASVSAACAGLMGAASREAQLLEKASYGKYRTFTGGYHTDMGNIFEDITANHYSRLNNTHVHDFRLIPHDNPEFAFLGASTDGVSDQLNNIEIKTLAGRALDSKIKKEYYHQMQHQMSCLGLHQTHFLEAKYETFPTLRDAARGISKFPYGVVLEFYSSQNGFKYLYSPDVLTDKEILAWESETVHLTEPGVYIRTIYWRMSGYQMKVVKRDPSWLLEMGPQLKKFWKELQALRANPKMVEDMIRARETKKESKRSIKPGPDASTLLL